MPLRALILAAAAAVLGACGHNDSVGDCSNGTCVCVAGSTCDLTCGAPPCHVDCAPGSNCQAVCANGECTCEVGASCSFACGAPPCHVTCGGDNPVCDGTCANGTCTCARDSSCHFACASGPCHASCAAGSHCVLTCPNTDLAGTPNCGFDTCAAGKATLCPDKVTVTCGEPCP